MGVECGGHHTLVICSDGSMHACGLARSCGIGAAGNHNDCLRLKKVQMPNDARVTCASGGALHSLAVLGPGTCCSWGAGAHGVLGHGDTVDYLKPRILRWFTEGRAARKSKIVRVAAGAKHSLVLTATGEVFGFGSNTYGQIGGERASLLPKIMPLNVGDDDGLTDEDRRDTHPHHAVLISAGGCHSILVTNKRRILHYGSNSRQPRERQLHPDDRHPRSLSIPSDDSDDDEKRDRMNRANGLSTVEHRFLTTASV